MGDMNGRFLVCLAVLVSSCTPASSPSGSTIPEATDAAVVELMASSAQPAVVNVWASWCLPCRAEAPLLREASRQFEDEVTFLGINIADDPIEAAAFIAEFGLDFDHVADPDRSIPALLGGGGVPITYFVAPGGEIVSTHLGIIDERTLAAGIAELLDRR